MKSFDDQFRQELRASVEQIESRSGAEIVAVVVPAAAKYPQLYVWCGAALSMLTLTVLTFIHIEVWYVLIYLETLAAFGVGMALPLLFPGLVRILTSESTRRKHTEIKARALFQESGICETRARIGVLMVFAWKERCVYLLPDSGARESMDEETWKDLTTRAQQALCGADPAVDIPAFLKSLAPVFEKSIPRSPDDINELPDELWLH